MKKYGFLAIGIVFAFFIFENSVFAIHKIKTTIPFTFTYRDPNGQLFATVSYEVPSEIQNQMPVPVISGNFDERRGQAARWYENALRVVKESCLGGRVRIDIAGKSQTDRMIGDLNNSGNSIFGLVVTNNPLIESFIMQGGIGSPSATREIVAADCRPLQSLTELCVNLPQDLNTGSAWWSDYFRWDKAPTRFDPGVPGLLKACPNQQGEVRGISAGGSYRLSWSSPLAGNCTLISSDLVAPREGVLGNITLNQVPIGVYAHTFSCDGVADGSLGISGGHVSRSIKVYIGDVPDTPKILSFTVSPNIISKGQKAFLKWQTANADKVTIKDSVTQQTKQVAVEEKGKEVMPTRFVTYTLRVENTAFPQLGSTYKTATLKVLAPGAPVPPPTPELPEVPEAPPEAPPSTPPAEPEELKLDLKINDSDGPLTISAPTTLTLSWNLDRYCLAYGGWFGFKTKAGSEQLTVTKPGDYNYRLYCPGFKSTSDEVKVTVVGGISSKPVVPGAPPAPPIPMPIAEASVSLDGKNFSKSTRVVRGKPTNLWLSAGYDVAGGRLASRSDDGKWSYLLSSGGRCDFNYDLNQGFPSFEASVFDPVEAKECTVPLEGIIFNDKPGVYRYGVLRLVQSDGKVSNISYINISVQEPVVTGPPVIDFTINGAEGPLSLGAPALYTLSWQVTNANHCEASGSWSGEKFLASSETFVSSLKREFEYTLTCTGKLGTSSKTVHLKVAELPVCEFTALPKVLGQSAFISESVLNWKCQFANSCGISPAVTESREVFGSVRVSPRVTTKYILTCENLEGKASFDQMVEVR